ncbi:GNAT family N-acetyltransferase [Micromonospora sp. KLBMP9576]|uniref:GNAT family N-acetyltransferase n=1 Tax=Micromonospora sp. KLBMP9576 TaxID=3424769 RepID=UPI003D8D3516
MRVERLNRLDDALLDRLGVASTRFYGAELERIQLAQRGHGTTGYLVAREADGTVLGMTPVYSAVPPWHPTVDPGVIFEPAVPLGGERLFLAGSYGVYANFLTVAADVPPARAATVAAALVDEARAMARAEGSGHVLLPYLDGTQAGWLDSHGYRALAADTRAKAVLPILWDSFDEYVSWLPSQGLRTSVRRERREFLDAGLVVREERMTEVVGRIAPLLVQTERRHGNDLDVQQVEFHYTLLAMGLREDFTALVAYADGEPVACSLLLACGNRWILKAWGCDYATAGGSFLYFNLLFYEPVGRAASRGIESIDYGLGGLGAKTRRGCTEQRLRTILIGAAAQHDGHPCDQPEGTP